MEKINKIVRISGKIWLVFTRIASLFMALSAALIIVNIITRKFFNAPIFGSTELIAYASLIIAALAMIGSITAYRTAKRGLEYRASDGGFAVVTCEDGTVYLRTEARGTWFSTADAKIDCGKGTYADEYESPFGTTYAMQKRFTVYTCDPTAAENKTPEKEN